MKKIKSCLKTFALFITCMLLLTNCKEEEELYPTFDTISTIRSTEIDKSTNSLSMTAYVQLPENLIQYMLPGDQLIVLSNEQDNYLTDKCRGVAEIDGNIFKVQIFGTASEQVNLYFLYYSSGNKYLYKTTAFLPFEVDKRFGTTDNPEVLPLTIITDK